MNLRIRSSALAALVILSACCDGECLSVAVIEFEPPVTETGAYRIEITTDEIHQVCETTLPVPSGENPCEDRLPGFGALDAIREDGQIVGFSGLLLVGPNGRGPNVIEVRLSRDETTIASDTLAPAYDDVSGSCGNCRTGTAVLPIQ